jgi:ABC-type spermidine/putrescine transport system permease subunit II
MSWLLVTLPLLVNICRHVVHVASLRSVDDFVRALFVKVVAVFVMVALGPFKTRRRPFVSSH